MKVKFYVILAVALMTASCLFAETEIVLHEVIEVGFIAGDSPLDDPGQEGTTPTRPTDFRALIDGNNLTIFKQNENIPFVHARVVKASTGTTVVNQQFTNSLSEQITNSGVYVLHINTEGGALVGQFIVQ